MSSLQLRRFVSGLAIAAALAALPAYADRTNGYAVRKSESSESYRFPGAYDRTVEVPHPAEWRNGKLFIVSHEDRARFAESSARMADTLRDGKFTEIFGKIIPKTKVENGSWLERSDRTGVPLRELSGSNHDRAEKLMHIALEFAPHLLHPDVDRDPAYFRFKSSSGEIASWTPSPPPLSGVETEFSLVKLIGEGANARVYQVRSDDKRSQHLQVIKVLKPYTPRRMPEEAPPRVLDALTREAEYLSDLLRNDKAFVERFGNIIPETRALAPGVIAQELAEGHNFVGLGSEAQAKARVEIKDLRAMLKRLAPGVIVTARTKNYLFHEDGRIASLYDIASDGHKAYTKAGLRERVYAYKSARE